jgi:flagellin
MSDVATRINQSKELTGVSATASAATGGPASLVLQSTQYGAEGFVSVDVLENLTAFSSQAASVSDYGTNGVVTINGGQAIVNGLDVAVRTGSLAMELTLDSTFGSVDGGSTVFEITGGGAIFAIAPTVGLAGQEGLGLSKVTTGSLGTQGQGFLQSLGSGATNDLSSKNFTVSQRIVREAIKQVSSLRGRLGGFQKNTLQTTMNSLNVALENVTAAESAIRDADFAAETSALTRAQILVNSSTVALQLANAQPQNALSLLG